MVDRTRTASAALAGALALQPRLAAAGAVRAQQAYPSQPIRFIVAFGPGGVGDTTARLVAEKLGDKLGQRVVVENNPGGGGISAARAVLTAPADGHTLALLTNGTSISVGLFKNLTFDPIADFAPVSKLGAFEFFIAVGANSPYRTLADLIGAARGDPKKLNIGTVNPGSTQHLSAMLLKSTAGIEFSGFPSATRATSWWRCCAATSTRPSMPTRPSGGTSTTARCGRSRPRPTSASRCCPTFRPPRRPGPAITRRPHGTACS